MAFVGDGSKSMQGAHDEIVDYMCGPCKARGNFNEARKYCCDCPEYLCDACSNYHQALAITKNHTIVSTDVVSGGLNRQLTIYCECNKKNEVEVYCENHTDAICGQCQSFKHHRCKTSPIQERSSEYTSTKLDAILSKTKSLKEKYDQLKQKCFQDEKKLKLSKENCKKEIHAFRKELDKFLDKLEQEMLAELDQVTAKTLQHIDQQISTLSTALQILDADHNLLKAAKNDARIHVMFAADAQISKRFHECESRLLELEKEAVKLSMAFEKDKKLDDLLCDTNCFGSLNFSEKATTKSEYALLLRQQIKPQRNVDVRMAGREVEPYITGCAVMPNGYVVICDYANSKIKLLDDSLDTKDSLDLLGHPWDVSVIDKNNIVVTLCMKKELQHVQIFPQMKTGRVLKQNKHCFGVAVSGDDVFVSCHNGPGQGEVRVLDKEGNIKRRLGAMFSQPSYITLSKNGDKVFVSDSDNNTITCMKVDGSIIFTYKHENLKRPRGLYCDDKNNVLVCNYYSDNVHIIEADGKKAGIIVSAKEGLKNSYSIAFRENDSALFMGSNRLKIYSMK